MVAPDPNDPNNTFELRIQGLFNEGTENANSTGVQRLTLMDCSQLLEYADYGVGELVLEAGGDWVEFKPQGHLVMFEVMPDAQLVYHSISVMMGAVEIPEVRVLVFHVDTSQSSIQLKNTYTEAITVKYAFARRIS